jgi:tRNA pseudouridine38-40 synthase
MHPQRQIKLTIAYDGTDYHGWQIQPGYKTVQGTLCEAVTSLFRYPTHVQGAARTDAGVHASGQVGLIKTAHPVPTEQLPLALNDCLPQDIAVRHAEEVGPDFDVMRLVARKGYRYTIYTGRLRPIRQIRFCWHIPGELSVEAMNAAAQHLVGTLDFRSFAATVDEDQNTVRTVFRCDVIRGCNGDPDMISIDIEGDGFLHHMVRNFVGTLVDISHGHWRPEQIVDILEARDRRAAGHLAPASGLCLEWIKYRGQSGSES